MKYKILSIIELEDINYLWEKWELFQCNSLLYSDLQINIQFNAQWRYGIEVLTEQPGKPVLKFEDSLILSYP